MTSVDELFKRPGLPGGGNKRKLPNPQNPNERYKSAKLSANGDVRGTVHENRDSLNATVQDDDEDDDEEAGPELPPDEEEEPADDEEGRFFGGGVSRNTADVLDFIESKDGEDQEAAGPEKYDSAWLKRLALNLEKKISKNAELRAKFESQPQKFMSSEADLDADIKALSILTEHPELYVEFADMSCLESLVSLLAHDNTDIAIDAIEVLSELTDEDVAAETNQWDALAEALIKADLPSLLIDNLARLDESNDADRNGVYYTLSLLENLCSDPERVENIIESSSLLEWLLSRIQKKESPIAQNTQYAAEILCITMQSTAVARLKVIQLNGVDTILQLLSSYRKRDPPKNTEEEEYAENLFDALISLVDDTTPSPSTSEPNSNTENPGKLKFSEAEGLELILIMLRESESKFSRPRALRVLDAALAGMPSSGANMLCEKLVVDLAGLKTIFSLFMKHKLQGDNWTSSCLGIFASLLKCLPGDSAARIRTLAKFVEKDYEKIGRLVSLRQFFKNRLDPVELELAQTQKDMSVEEIKSDMASLTRRLEAGLAELQNVDTILAWLVAEDDGAKTKVSALLSAAGSGITDIKRTLNDQLQLMDVTESTAVDTSNGDQTEQPADLLRTLIELLL